MDCSIAVKLRNTIPLSNVRGVMHHGPERQPKPAMTVAATRAHGSRADVESRLARADPALGRVIAAVVARIGPQRIPPSHATPFEALVRAIIYQSVSGKAAASIFGRLREAVSAPLTPSKVAALRPQSLTKAGLSKAKAHSIRHLAEWFISNAKLAKTLPILPDDEIVEALTSISGIGPWTVNVFLIFNLGRLDVLPAADLGIRRGVELTYGLRAAATPKQVLERSRTWQPYRSIASIYLWQAAKLKLGPNDLDGRKRR
jgi:DNA-3-methyladenine glycosylase II